MIKVIHCTVNGKVREIAVDERESLTDMLRLRLGLTSVKKGCEAGECGACTVLIDGVTKNSCILLAVWADGHEIITRRGYPRQKRAAASGSAGVCGRSGNPVRLLHPRAGADRRGAGEQRKTIYP